MRRFAIATVGLGCVLLMGLLHFASPAQQPQPVAAGSARHVLVPYARARWRLAPEQLHRVALKIAHIAIRHRDSDNQAAWLRGPSWQPDPPVKRTRAEAIDRAFEVSDEIQRAPERFAALAREYSNDIVTGPWGGELGLVRAAQLPSEFLDTIAELKPGEVSRPFETSYGIHLLKLEAAAPVEQLAATRILIGYQPSSLAVMRPGHEVKRSREAASALATELVREARKPGADFEALVERYSDAVDAERHGDLGVWSSDEPTRAPLVLEALSRTSIGEVTEPVDTSEGLQILKRVPVTERERFAMDYVVVVPLGRSHDEMQAQMNDIVAAVTADPAKFDSFRSSVCCNVPMTWARGRGPDSKIERALRASAVGAIDLDPIETAAGIYLVRKREVPELLPSAPLARLPAPDMPDLDAILQNANNAQLAGQLQVVARHIALLPLDAAKRERLDQLVKTVSGALPAATPPQRVAVLHDFWQDAARILSAHEVELLRHSITAFTKSYLMNT